MMDYMNTPMASNLKLLSVASLDSVDSTMYRQMICSLMNLTDTRPDTCFVVNTLRHAHLMAAKHAVRYLKGTVDYGLKYEVNQNITWICIEQAVPLIGKALRGATSIWDQV